MRNPFAWLILVAFFCQLPLASAESTMEEKVLEGISRDHQQSMEKATAKVQGKSLSKAQAKKLDPRQMAIRAENRSLGSSKHVSGLSGKHAVTAAEKATDTKRKPHPPHH